jgi:hypothetical protein
MPTIDKIRNAVEKKGYRFFTQGNYNLNIVGVRTANPVPNKFDDTIYVCYRQDEKWRMDAYRCTTDPGLFWLENPMVARGTAIMKPGQYRGAYKIGTHRGYKALAQIGGPVTILIDSNRDSVLDFDVTKEDSGYFGINIHRARMDGTSTVVDKWSAGCQVFADSFSFEAFLETCEKSRDVYGNSFTYTLLEEADV